MKKYLPNQKGLAPVVFILIVAVFLTTAFVAKNYPNLKLLNVISKPTASSKPVISTPSAQISPTPNKSSKAIQQTSVSKASTKTITPTPKPSSVSTSTTTPVDNSCSYDLSGPTGAVQVNIKPKSNQVVGDQIVELQAKSGCKVLDGRSTDKQTMIARAGGNGYSSQNSVNFSTVPPGSYSVRIQYKGQWTGYSGVDAVASQLKTVEFTVDGEVPPATPAPTPTPKTTCVVGIVSKSSETVPSTVTLTAGANIYKPPNLADKYITAAQWDFNGDGIWDTDMSASSYQMIPREYTEAGNYTVKARVQLSDGETTDTCSNSFSLSAN